MKEKIPDANDENIGRWMTRMSVLGRGSLDPSKLGDFFSQHWTESILHYFTKSLNLEDMTVVEGLEKLFETFKPGGVGQVIDRVLREFAQAYCEQNLTMKMSCDTVHSLAFSIIMLNTDLHGCTCESLPKFSSLFFKCELFFIQFSHLRNFLDF